MLLQKLNEQNRLIQALSKKVESLEAKVDIVLSKFEENEMIVQQDELSQDIPEENRVFIRPLSHIISPLSTYS